MAAFGSSGLIFTGSLAAQTRGGKGSHIQSYNKISTNVSHKQYNHKYIYIYIYIMLVLLVVGGRARTARLRPWGQEFWGVGLQANPICGKQGLPQTDNSDNRGMALVSVCRILARSSREAAVGGRWVKLPATAMWILACRF